MKTSSLSGHHDTTAAAVTAARSPPCDDEDDEGLARRVVSVWLRAFYPTKPSIGIKM